MAWLFFPLDAITLSLSSSIPINPENYNSIYLHVISTTKFHCLIKYCIFFSYQYTCCLNHKERVLRGINSKWEETIDCWHPTLAFWNYNLRTLIQLICYNIYTFHHLIIDSSMQRCFSKNLIREQQNACVIGNVPFYSLYLHSCGWLPCRLPQSEHPAHNKSLPPPASLPKILYWLQKQYKLELLYKYGSI